MAKSKNEDETTKKLLWIGGGAAVTAAVMYFVNRTLSEREELKRLRFESEQKSQLKEAE